MAVLIYRKVDVPTSFSILVAYTDVWYWDFDLLFFITYRYPYQDSQLTGLIPDVIVNNVIPGGKEVFRGDSLSRDELTSIVFKLIQQGITGTGGTAVTPSGTVPTAANQLTFNNSTAQSSQLTW